MKKTPHLRSTLFNLPKIDLHRHLEGSVRPGTVADICKAHKIELPTYDHDGLADILRLSKPAANLEGFLLPFRLIKFSFTDKEAIARITYEVIEDAAADNVDHLEIRFSPEFMAFYHKLPLTDVMDGIVEGLNAAKGLKTTARLIISISRDLSPETMKMPWPEPEEIAKLAVEYADRGVVGLDLAGVENGFPPELFIDAFKIARDAGLGITVHAGEDDGPQSIRSAIEVLGASRIGHGVRITQDPEVMRLAKDRGVALEICPTSNVLTNAVESLEAHPIRRLFDEGIRVTVNSDDPTVTGMTLTDEYAIIAEVFAFTFSEIQHTIDTARKAAF